MINAHGLKPGFEYRVFVDLDGVLPGSIGTAGPWQMIGDFLADADGDGHFKCSTTLPVATGASQVSIFINEKFATATTFNGQFLVGRENGLTVLISGNVSP
jgi:hypothetical protein